MAQIKNEYADDDGIANAYRVNPYMIPYYTDPETGEQLIQHYPGNKGTLGTDGNQFSDFVSPLDVMKNSTHKRTSYRLLGNIYLQFDIIPGLFFKSTFSPTYSNYRDGQYSSIKNPNIPTQNYKGGTLTDNPPTATSINNTSFGYTWDNMINYNATFNKIHSVGAMALISTEHSSSTNYQWVAQNVLEGSDWYNMPSGNTIVDPDAKPTSKSSYSEGSMLSYALRVNYGFKNRYLFTGTVRWDGSSKFAKDYRWGSFPSAAFAWRASEEAFLRDVNWLTNLKLRLSYGVTGNNKGVGNYATIAGLTGLSFYPTYDGKAWNWTSGMAAASIVDEMIKWEKSNEVDFGIDFGFLQDRITGTVDIYQKNSHDLLYQVNLPLESGGKKMDTNVGKVRNTGVEVSLTTVNIDKRDWTWTTTFTFAHNKNTVREINGIEDHIIDGVTGTLWCGYPFANVYNWEWAGIVNDKNMTVPDNEAARAHGYTPGQSVQMTDYYYNVYGLTEGQPYVTDVDGNGVIDDNDKVIKSSDPKWTGSISSSLMYRMPGKAGSLDFGFNIYFKQGYYVNSSFMNGDYYDLHDRGRGKMYMENYIPAGTLVDAEGVNADGTWKSPTYQNETFYGDWPVANSGSNDGLGAQSTYYQTARGTADASFVKVKNITLGYNFAPQLLKAIRCQSLRLYFTITNPFCWTSYKGFDPEWAGASGKNDGPSVISYQIGANIKF